MNLDEETCYRIAYNNQLDFLEWLLDVKLNSQFSSKELNDEFEEYRKKEGLCSIYDAEFKLPK